MNVRRGLLIAIALAVTTGMFSLPAVAETPYTISVKILADNKELMVRRLWEKRYRDRLAAASDIIERCCHVRFKVVEVSTWTSSDDLGDLGQLMEEFMRKVRPEPAQLVIGFTGQYRSLREDKHIGGAKGPFCPYVLIREWGRQVTDSERLEILVHELGHYLGAAHSPDRKSVMRPDISDRQSRARAYQISFDTVNAAVLRVISDELRKRPVGHLAQLSPEAKEQLRPLYRSLVAALPNDPAAPHYLAMLDRSLGVPSESSTRVQAVLAGARLVVRAVSDTAADNHLLPEKSTVGGAVRFSKDELTELYVRRAAAAANRLPQNVAAPAFLLGIGVALDDSNLLPSAPIVGEYWRQIEPQSARTTRVALLGEPTMRGRRDLTLHFAASAALTILVNSTNAEAAGIGKEISDSRSGGSGFSFADLSADLAGIQFAAAVAGGRIPLARLENGFVVRDFLPDPSKLKEGIAWDDFARDYGFPPDARFLQERQRLLGQIVAMPGYRSSHIETMLRELPHK
jgi:hypothetical protein